MSNIKTNDPYYEKNISGNYFINKNTSDYELYRANREKIKEIIQLKEDIKNLRQEISEIKKKIGLMNNG